MWPDPRKLRWHHWVRIISVLVMVDQALLPWLLPLLPEEPAYFLAAFGALCAPVPTERR